MAHHNYFSSKQANATIATLLGTFCYTPYTGWKKGHDYHHRHSNNTDSGKSKFASFVALDPGHFSDAYVVPTCDRKQYAQTAPLTVQQYSGSIFLPVLRVRSSRSGTDVGHHYQNSPSGSSSCTAASTATGTKSAISRRACCTASGRDNSCPSSWLPGPCSQPLRPFTSWFSSASSPR
eukprot:1125945-Rhodomonas_salina.3